VAAEKEEQHCGECNHYSSGLLFSREPKQQQTDQEDFNAQGDGEKKAGENLFQYNHSFSNSADSGLRTSLSYHSPLRMANGHKNDFTTARRSRN
jgi:hypothetical protein